MDTFFLYNMGIDPKDFDLVVNTKIVETKQNPVFTKRVIRWCYDEIEKVGGEEQKVFYAKCKTCGEHHYLDVQKKQMKVNGHTITKCYSCNFDFYRKKGI